jgi:pimeloyl-ACP methyl ester carboxylesterase
MKHSHSIRVAVVALLLAWPSLFDAQQPAPVTDAAQTYTVFLRSQAVGQESVALVQQPDGWLLRGSNRLGAPLDIVSRNAEVHYDTQWRPTRLLVDGTVRGQEVLLKIAFADGQATSEMTVDGKSSSKVDQVAADTLVLPNGFLGSYAALAKRLIGQKAGASFRGYIAPQGEVAIRLDGASAERIETPKQVIAATRFALVVSNPPPAGDMAMSVWTDASGALLRMSVPAQMLDFAREDVASAATRTTSFSIATDETVRIPASGFGLAASVAKPVDAKAPLPAIVLVGGMGSADRDGFVAGIPVLGQLAAGLVDAGFLVVRYDKRGAGQSGGRVETATIADQAEDVRAIIRWLEKQRKDIDKKRISLVGHAEGAWVALNVAARDKRVAAVALLAAASVPGGQLILEQQQHLLDRLKTPDADKQAKIALQTRINTAVLKGTGWDDIPSELRSAADTPWFSSFLAFDPARIMRDVRQPILIVHGELDTQVRAHHADRLADLARARKRKVTVDVVRLPGVNHLLVPAKTGEADEYATLPEKKVASTATAAIAAWLARIVG